MVIHNLLGDVTMDYYLAKLITDLRARFIESGGQPEDFPDYLKEQGVECSGFLMKIEDSLMTMARLKFG